MDALHLSLQDLVLCLERSVIYSSPEMLLPEVCQGRLYPFDIQAVIWPGAFADFQRSDQDYGKACSSTRST